MPQLSRAAARLRQSAVIWSWAFNGLRLASAVLLLPLLVRLLSKDDLGMHYLLLSLGALAMMVDFGFAGATWRAVCSAMAGGREILAEGHAAPAGPQAGPNHELLWDLLTATRTIYRGLALLALLLLGTGGTFLVARHAHATSSPELAWAAWAFTLAGAVWEVYAGWWTTYLAGLNRVVTVARLNCLAYALKLAFAAALLLAGLGLLAVPLAGLLAVFLQRLLARRACLQALAAWPPPGRPAEVRSLLRRLWPNSWRQGVIGVGAYLGANAVAFLCVELFGLAANAQYGLSLQLITVCQGMAGVWTQVKWPVIAQHCARGDFAAMRRAFRPRLRLQLLTFIALAGAIVPLAQPLLDWLGSDKHVLSPGWFALLAFAGLLEMQFSVWALLIATGNRVPYAWPALCGTLVGMTLSLVLVTTTSLGLAGLILGPLLAGGAFNYWYWPGYGARAMGTTWPRFMFQRQA